MADKEIGELTPAGALTGAEMLHVVQGGNSRSTTTGAIAALGGNSGGGAVQLIANFMGEGKLGSTLAATKGNRIVPYENATVHEVWGFIQNGLTGQSYKAIIAELLGTAIAAIHESPVVALAVDGPARISGKFLPSVVIEKGKTYFIGITRTDATDTTAVDLETATAQHSWPGYLPGPGGYFSSKDPQVGASLSIYSNTYHRIDLVLGVASEGGGGGSFPYGGARIRPSALQNYSVTGAYDAVRFDTVDRDTDGFWNATAPNRFTIPQGVTKVRLTASLKVDSADPIENNTFLFAKNGKWAETPGIGNTGLGGSGYNNPSGMLSSDVLDVHPGDYFELMYFVSGSFSLNADRFLTWFAIEVVERTTANVGLNADLGGLLDVDTATELPAVGDSLIWDGNKWVPGVPVVAANAAQGMYKPFRGAMAKLNANKAFSAMPVLPVPWDGVDYDTNNFWSAGSSGRLTVPAGVKKVRLSAAFDFDGAPFVSSGSSLLVQFAKNGVTDFRGVSSQGVRTGYSGSGVSLTSAVLPVVEGDFFEIRLNSSVSALTILASRCYFALEVVEAEETLP